jgi:hypothetical protein
MSEVASLLEEASVNATTTCPATMVVSDKT